MKQVGIKLKSALVGLLYGALCSTPAVAEDIEIYTGSTSPTTAATANILFALDTSGSMGNMVAIAPPAYDSTKTYTGCFDTGRLYTQINFDNEKIAGTTYNGPQMYCRADGPANGYNLTTRDQFNVSAFKCNNAVNALTTTGFYIDRIAQYRSNRWRSINGIDSDKLTQPVECRRDQGKHGEASGDGEPYATNKSGEGGWKSTGTGINWNNKGSSETVYSGNYLNHLVEEPGSNATRLEIMQNALTDVINSSSGVNVGLLRYSRNGHGGLVVTPMGEISATKTAFLAELAKMDARGATPLAESYYEAVSYMQGDAVDYGNSSTVQQLDASGNVQYDLNRLSHADSRTPSGGASYKSPIASECQKNFIVLLTDGLPSSSDDPSAKLGNIGVTGGCSAIGTSRCLEEIASAIGSQDQSAVTGDQFISTFTIGLDIASAATLLQGTADASKTATGVGEYYPASDAVSLTAAFSKIVTQVLDVDTSFSSPAVSVNAFNRSTHLDDLYFTLFKPGEGPHWAGNLKKYKLKFFTDSADTDGDGDTTERLPFIADALGADAVDVNTGFFKDSAMSYWTSGAADGKEVGAGGAAGALTATRNVYTVTGNYTAAGGVNVPSNKVLTTTANAVDKANASLTDALLGITGFPEKIAGTAYRDTLLDWANSLDVFDKDTDGVTNEVYQQMGDPLHAEPALVQYGGTVAAPDLVAYVATNDGYLHAFNASNGQELFSFIPQELLSNLSLAMENNSSDKLYGLDGNVVAWINDVNKDGTISAADGDHVYLYVSMRRGGRNIYALDVTVRTAPELLWVIKGGTGDYAELGETWSTINVEKVKDGATEKTVLIFGGGYDANQDDVTVRTADTQGRAVFIADATSGARLWSAGNGGDLTVANMDYSIPARVKPLDISGDGFTDRLYVADTGGQIFRFDINNTNGAALTSSITGGRIVDIAGAADVDARRFYYPPDVALVDGPEGKYHGLVMSTGFRAHPLNDVIHDRIYMIKDRNTGLITSNADYKYNPSSPTTVGSLTEADLHDATANIAGGNAADDATRDLELAAIEGAEGWYISLDDEDNTGSWLGEKGLAEPLIIEGTAVIATYTPNIVAAGSICQPPIGVGKVFRLDILDATPAFPSNLDLRPERHKLLARTGIPPSPNVIITKGGEPTLCIGTECEAADFGLGVRKTYWYEVEQ